MSSSRRLANGLTPALPFLSRTEVLLAPVPVLVITWIISLFTFDCATNLAPVLWCGVNLRKAV